MVSEPAAISRRLVIAGLLVLLLFDLFIGVPSSLFVGGGIVVLLTAAGIHVSGEERRAAAGWLVFASALAVFGLFEIAAHPVYLIGFLTLLVGGLILLVSERLGSHHPGSDDSPQNP